MSFMERDVQFGDWIEVDGSAGTEFIPADVVGALPTAEEFTTEENGYDEDAHNAALAMAVRDYTESNWIASVTERKGWGARLSAPGYMDCTEWAVFDTEEEANDYLEEMYGDDEADDSEDEDDE